MCSLVVILYQCIIIIIIIIQCFDNGVIIVTTMSDGCRRGPCGAAPIGMAST